MCFSLDWHERFETNAEEVTAISEGIERSKELNYNNHYNFLYCKNNNLYKQFVFTVHIYIYESHVFRLFHIQHTLTDCSLFFSSWTCISCWRRSAWRSTKKLLRKYVQLNRYHKTTLRNITNLSCQLWLSFSIRHCRKKQMQKHWKYVCFVKVTRLFFETQQVCFPF